VTTLLLLCVEGFWQHREYGDLGVLTSTSIASLDNEVFRWILRTGCGLVLAKRFWIDERLMSANGVRRENAALSCGCKTHPVTAPTGSSRSSYGGDEIAEAFGKLSRITVTARVCRP
jgi:hypothetical protein